MLRKRRQVTENGVVAREMRSFFRNLSDEDRSDPEGIAKAYARHLFRDVTHGYTLKKQKQLSRSRYYVGFATHGSNFTDLTKRTALVTDTLLLSHHKSEKVRDITQICRENRMGVNAATNDPGTIYSLSLDKVGFRCNSLSELGTWLLASEPLLKAGLAWYLPSYTFIPTTIPIYDKDQEGHWLSPVNDQLQDIRVIDYLVQDGRAVDASGATPEKSEVVRPILQIDLPFIEGVNLHTFSKITVDEFESYTSFRNFLRGQFLNLDESLNAVQSQRELDKVGVEISNQVHAMKAEMNRITHKRAIAVTSAGVGTVSAILAAVYGPAFAEVIKMLGASSGAWGLLTALAENSPRNNLKENKWYYVWVLQQEAMNR